MRISLLNHSFELFFRNKSVFKAIKFLNKKTFPFSNLVSNVMSKSGENYFGKNDAFNAVRYQFKNQAILGKR